MQSTIFFLIENQKEAEILRLFFQNHLFHVLNVQPNYAGFLQVNQYKPIGIIAELTTKAHEIIRFVHMVRKTKYADSIPIVAYGSHSDKREVDGFYVHGFTLYLRRPLKTGELLSTFKKFIVNEKKSDLENENSAQNNELVNMFLDKAIDAQIKRDTVVKSVGSLKALPFTMAKIQEIIHKSDTCAQDLAKVITVDPVLTSRLLKISNSVYYAVNNRRISDIKEAIVRIGLKESKNIVLSKSLIESMGNEPHSFGFDRLEFWYHCLATAIIAEKLVTSIGYSKSEEAFLAGLLHDFGIIVMDEHFHALLTMLLERTTAQLSSFFEEEQNNLDIHFIECVIQLFEKWRLPKRVIGALKDLSDFEFYPGRDAESILKSAVGIANIIANTLNFGKACDLFVKPVESAKFLCTCNTQFFDEITEQLEMYGRFLNIDKEYSVFTEKDRYSCLKIAIVNYKPFYFDPIERFFVARGGQVYRPKKIDEIASMNDSADLLLIHTCAEQPFDELKQFFNLVRNDHKNFHNPEDLTYVPVILFHEQDYVLPDYTASNPLITTLSYGFDVRILDNIMDAFKQQIPLDTSHVYDSLPLCPLEHPQEAAWVQRTSESINRQLSVSCRIISDESIILELVGSVYEKDIDKVKSEFEELLKIDYRYIALNFKQLESVDSMFIGVIVSVYKQIVAKKSELFFINVDRDVLEVFTNVGLNKVFTILEDEDAFINRIQSKITS